MSTKLYYLSGMFKWAKVQKPDEKFNIYTLDFYPDEDSTELYNSSGMQLKWRSDEDGDFIKLRRPVEKTMAGELVSMGKPEILLKDKETGEYSAFEGLIGNGSVGTVKVAVFDTARGKGHELRVVAVDDLVPFGETEVLGNDDGLPF